MRESFMEGISRNIFGCGRLRERDSLWEFPCYRDDGNIFDWHGLKGRPVLLLYGGLGCMGEDGRKELELLRRQTSLEDLQIVVYWPCRSLKDLQEVKKVFPFDFIFVSDFKLDDSPMKIKYGAQATPTCFLTDEHHVVKVKCGGLRMDLFDKYIKKKRMTTEKEVTLNAHNKAEYPPMHTCEHILNQTMVRMFGCERSRNAHIERKKK